MLDSFPLRRSRSDYTDHVEEQGLARAVAASLAISGPGTGPTQGWTPQSQDDWRVLKRQRELEEMAGHTFTEEEDSKDSNKPSSKLNGNIQASNLAQNQGDNPSPNLGMDGSSPQEPDPATEANPDANVRPPRETIEDRIKEMELGNPVDLPWIDDHDGDTWVFIDPAAQQPEQTDQMYLSYTQRYAKPLIIKSSTLKQLHSAFFDKLLGPDNQFRTVRRRGLKGKLPTQIRYVIDLTPPTEGDEAAWLMSELCCIDTLRNWWKSGTRWDVSATLVGGRDDFTAPPGDTRNINPIPEISPIRHRACIERVLNAVRDIDPRLDSAVKVYSTFVVACFFDVTRNPFSDYIIRWLRAPPNSLFIEVLPEVALKMGDGLQCSELIRDSFAILVGEEALELINPKPRPDYSLYGRKKNDIPENYKTRVEYASKALQDRITQIFLNLVDEDMTWMETLPEYRKLLFHDKVMTLLVCETKKALKAYVRGAIYCVLASDLTFSPRLWHGAGGADCLYPRTEPSGFWNELDVSQRIMTTTFWQALKQMFISSLVSVASITNLTAWSKYASAWGSRLDDALVESLTRDYDVVEIRESYLKDLMSRCRGGHVALSAAGMGTLKPIKEQPSDIWETDVPLLYETRESASQLQEIGWDTEGTSLGPRVTPHLMENQYKDSYLQQREATSDQPTVIRNSGGIDINLMQLKLEISDYIKSVCDKMTSPPDPHRTEPMYTDMTLTLVSLDQSEWKYLPLYAGGLDDGSGGVFNDDVPVADVGFTTAGPRIHRGTGCSTASSEFDFVEQRDLDSTVNSSTATNDGFSDQMDHRRVYDSGSSGLWDRVWKGKDMLASETGTMAASSTTGDESEDGFVLPLRTKVPERTADHPPGEMNATNAFADEANEIVYQDNYDDIFINGDEDEGDEDEDDDDDTITEKGDDDDELALSDDEDLVII
ncbi:MAG: hypothetical protein Q9219_003799 [cf. Caloplaca sp. 3 TL-2023]